MPPSKQRAPRKPPATPLVRPQPKTTFEVVDPIWLAQALALSLIAALVCAWLTLCLLFRLGEWQLVLHPSRTIDRTPANLNLSYEPIRFDALETGQPRLTAWWLPAQSTPQPGAQLSFQPIPKYAAFTVLYLHDGAGSLSATLPALARLHQAGLNIFAIDYRGFGQSDASDHPTEARMAQDTAAALTYLITTRHIPAQNIIPYGAGLGASLAANLAHAHPELPAIILDNPDPDPTATAIASHPSHLIPVRLLFHERFDIAAPLATLTTPKLLIIGGPNSTNTPTDIHALQTLSRHAASPTFTITLPPTNNEAIYQNTLTRFLDEYLPTR
jgi:pimeloyl-ACP methyl ester carboxylesterase